MSGEQRMFSIAPGVYSRIVLRRTLTAYWWVALLPLTVVLWLGATRNSSWYYVAPMVVFLIYPFFLFNSYFMAASSKEAVDGMKPHTLKVDANGATMEFYGIEEAEKSAEKPEKGSFRIYGAEACKDKQPVSRRFIAKDRMARITENKEFYIIEMRGARNSLILFPKILADAK